MRLRVLGTVLLILASSTPALAQWTWLNPKPQGHTLHDVEFLDDDTAIAVGEVGTIMVTNDAGVTWGAKTKVNGITATLRAIARIDDLTAVAVGGGGLILKTSDAGTTWTQIQSGTPVLLEDVDFEAGVAIAIGNGVMRRSTNAGNSWSPVTLGAPYVLHAVDVVTESVIVAVAETVFLRSEDGGVSWASTFIAMNPITVAFADEENGVTAFYSSFYFTNDGGTTWEERFGPYLGTHYDTSPSEIVLDGIESLFVSVTAGGCDGMMNCFTAGDFFRSADGAGNWDVDYSARPLHGLSRSDNGVVIAVGDAGSIYRWSDSSWQRIGGSPYGELDISAGAAFLSPSVGIVAGTQLPIYIGSVETTFLRTSDSGANWTAKRLFGTYIADVAYAPGTIPPAYAVGKVQLDGVVSTALLKSSNGGATWPTLWSSTSAPSLNAIEFQSGSHGVAVGEGGSFIVVDNDVVTPGTIVDGGYLFDVTFADGSVVVAVGSTGGNPPTTSRIVRSVDGGTTWDSVPHTAGSPFYGVDFASSTIGIVVGGAGRMIRTEDGGATWNPVVSPTTQPLLAVSFSSEQHGMAVGNLGTVIETSDGGASWSPPLPSPTTVGFRDVMCFSPTHAILTSWDLIVLEYKQTPLPTLIASFVGIPSPFVIDLSWSVRNDVDLAEFRIERSGKATGSSRSFRDVPASARSFRDDSVVPGASYDYILVAIDSDGTETTSAPIAVSAPEAELALLPNVPNPFNPSTTIRYVLPARGNVRVSIYDIAGRLVTTLVDREEAAGPYGVEWNGTGADGARVSSGVYLVRIEAGKQSLSRKMVLLK